MIAGSRIVLGVTGGVAAYKSVYLARLLIERGAQVRVVMTPAATRFVGAQTFSSITGRHPLLELWGADLPSPHTDLADWANLVVVAPCTANTLAKLATGTSTVAVAPAMHTEMWIHPSTVANLTTLRERGVLVLGPVAGELAGGDVGLGRMLEPDDIVAALEDHVTTEPGPLSGRRVLVSAGGTREAIDPVRYVGNRSTGKMGHAIAAAAARLGAAVTLVTTRPETAPGGVETIAVESAAEMAEAVWSRATTVDAVVLSAAVADYRPADPVGHKLRRTDGPPRIVLEATPDILAGVVAMEDRPFVVGFAAEVGSLDGAIAKAKAKGVDLLVGNDVARPGSGFGTDTNQVVIVEPDGAVDEWPLLTKDEVGERLMRLIADRLA